MNKSKVWEYVKAIGTALILALIIRTFIVQAFKIPSGSMIPTLLVGDHLLVNKFIYGTQIPFSDKRIILISSPKKGDIIVFKYPEDPSRDFIKRVMATEGDMIEQKDKKIYINGNPAKEPYVQHTDKTIRPSSTDPRDNFGPFLIPRNKFFVMGDNRDQSYDSRFWGYVDIKDIRGKAFILYWSWDSDKTMPRFGRIGNLIH
ncbi:MAG: signal peptidase I [Nitrospirae bacterium]|nr:signal peptidase I [Nitrospirota bacterium]